MHTVRDFLHDVFVAQKILAEFFQRGKSVFRKQPRDLARDVIFIKSYHAVPSLPGRRASGPQTVPEEKDKKAAGRCPPP